MAADTESESGPKSKRGAPPPAAAAPALVRTAPPAPITWRFRNHFMVREYARLLDAAAAKATKG